ncbi:MAG: hypothetical protein KZQ93_16850 [Candidatus Thiodiazotropha sp. (ex Monitilora ramsayi)]|nr:hypothetical protein [Candidatus Thiodiazotropha sp. (ex Monitilora ramsayi)]
MPTYANLFRSLLFAFLGGAGHCLAQQPYEYPNPVYGSSGSNPAWMLQDDNQFRWRPDETEPVQESSSSRGSGWNQRDDVYTPATDYVDEPLGLPPGTYRRIDERHTITPHQDGFRFRPIEPSEQERVKDRNIEHRRKQHVTETPPSQINGWGNGGYYIEKQPPKPRFRPDSRFDKKPGSAPSRYSYPRGSGSPVFRPE